MTSVVERTRERRRYAALTKPVSLKGRFYHVLGVLGTRPDDDGGRGTYAQLRLFLRNMFTPKHLGFFPAVPIGVCANAEMAYDVTTCLLCIAGCMRNA